MMRTHGWGWRYSWALGVILPLLLTGRPGIAFAADVHAIHAPGGTATLPCSDCHTGSKHNSSIQSGGSGTIEVPEAAGANSALDYYYLNGNTDSDGAYNTTTKVCANVDCHFGPGGTGTTNDVQNVDVALKCGTCHPAAADTDNFSFGDGTLAKINTTQWGESGHGATGTLPSGNAGANLAGPATDPEGCAYCHDFTVAHGLSANPFRLANNNALNHGWNDVCLVCHSTGDAGYNPGAGYTLRGNSGANSGKAVDAAHYGASHGGTEGGKFCWDCHDPHGDRGGGAGNIYMVQSAVSKTSDSTYGVPGTTATVSFIRTVISPGIGTVGYYVETFNSTATGVCQACHTDIPANFTGEVKYWRSNQSEDTNSDGTSETPAVADRHNSASVCTDCHKHESQFGAGCTDCHGNQTSGERWPDGVSGNNPTRSAYADDPGAHQKHIDDIFTRNGGTLAGTTDTDKKNNTCGWCHPGNPPPGHPGDATSGAALAEVTRMDTTGNGFQSTPRGADDYWYFTGFADATTGTAVYIKTSVGADDTDAFYQISGTQRTCLNANCHSNVTTPNWYGSTDTTPPTVVNVLTNTVTNLSIQQGTAAVTLTADASDTAGAITAGEYFFGTEGNAGEGTSMSAADGVFNSTSEGLRAVVDTAAWTSAGSPYKLFVDAKDASNNWGPTTAATVQVTVTGQDSFTVANTVTATENVNTGATNVVMQRLNFTVNSGTVDLLTVKVLGTANPGDVAADVAQVKICRDDGDGNWEGTGIDAVIGSGFLDATTKDVTIDIADQSLPTGASYLYILFDISGSAVAGDVLGAQLTALTFGLTDSLGTTLPVPLAAQNVKTIDAGAPPVVEFFLDGNTSDEKIYFLPSIQEQTTTITLTAIATEGRAIYHPSGAGGGGTTGWTCSDWAANLLTIDPDPFDGSSDGSKTAYSQTASATADIALADPAGMTQTITSVDACAVFTVAGETLDPSITLFISGVQTITGWQTLDGKTTYKTVCYSGFAGPGGNWDWSEIQNTTIRLRVSGTATRTTVTEAYLRVNYSDPTSTGIAAAEYFIDSEGTAGTGVSMNAADGSYDSQSETVKVVIDTSSWAAVNPATPRVYTVYVDAKDAAGYWGPANAVQIKITVNPKTPIEVSGTPQ